MASIRLKTAVPGPKSLDLVARRDAVGARGAAHLTDVAVARAHGAIVEDLDGNKLLDFAGGIGVLAVGHTPDDVVAAIREQAEKLVHVCAIVGTDEPFVALLERLVAITPGTFRKKAVLLNSGAEAIETSVKIARAATGRQAIVVFEGAYHGRTNMTLGMTSKYGLFKTGFGPFPSEIYRLPFPDLYRRPAGWSEDDAVDDAIRRFDKAMIAQIDPSAIAAIVIEPVQGEGGFVPAPARFLRHLRALCDRHDIVFVADEVQSGLARTGRLWAVDHADVVPDLLVTAKSLGAGMPIAAVVGKADLVDAPHPGGLGGTYSGNPLACAAALAALDSITRPEFLEAAVALGERMRAGLERIAAVTDEVGEVRGVGPMLAMEFVRDKTTKEPYPALVLDITKEALKRGLIVIRAGLYSNCIRLLPPLTMTQAETDEGLAVLAEAVAAAVAARSETPVGSQERKHVHA